MDKIYISQDGENKLFRWRDEHKNLVRNYKASTKKVKYILLYETNNPIIITVIDSGEARVDFTITRQGKRLDSFRYDRYKMTVNEKWYALKEPKSIEEVKSAGRQEAISIHASTQALLNHRQRIEVDKTQEFRETVTRIVERIEDKERRQKKDNIIRISDIIYTPVEASTRGFRSYTKPTREISVRGHYRHYRSGKTIWIEEYKKNAGKDKKPKKYNMGL